MLYINYIYNAMNYILFTLLYMWSYFAIVKRYDIYIYISYRLTIAKYDHIYKRVNNILA